MVSFMFSSGKRRDGLQFHFEKQKKNGEKKSVKGRKQSI